MEFKIKNISKFLPIFLVIVFVSSVFILTPIHQADASFWNWDIDETILNLVSGILYIFITFFLWLAGLLVVIAAWLVDCFLHPVIYEQVFKSPAIDKGWTICRDMCNLFFVMLLLAIAFATIFRIQTYSAKALLPKFILAIFLINFSKVIATIVIDFGQIFMFEFVDWMVSFGEVSGSPGAMSALTSTYKQYGSEFGLFNTAMGGWNSIDEMFTFDALLKVSFATIMTICMALVYFILAGLLLVRLVALALLIVLSPFAFISVILPGTRSQSSKWWSSLFKYTMIGPIFVFFIFISSEMSKEMVGTGYFVNPPDDLGIIDTMLISSVQNIVVLGMLLASVSMTKSMGIAGASAIIGGTAGIGLMAGKAYRGARYGAGKAKGAAGQVSKRVPAVGKAVDTVKSGYRGALKKAGLHGAALKGEKGEDDAKKVKMEAVIKEYGDPEHASLEGAEAMAKSKKGDATDEKKAYYLKAKLTQGETLTQDDMKLLPTAQRALDRKTLDEMTNKQVGLTTETTGGQKKVAKLEATGLSREDAKTKVVEDKMSELVSEGKAGKVIDLGDERVAQAWHDKQTSSQRDSSMKTMTEEQRKNLAGGYDKLTSNNYGGLTDDEKIKDLEIRVNTAKLTGDLEKAFTDAATGNSIDDDSVARGVDQLKPGDIAKLDKGSIDEFAHFISNSKITNLIKSGEQGAVNDIRVSLENKRRTFAVGTTEHTLLTNKINNIVNKLTS